MKGSQHCCGPFILCYPRCTTLFPFLSPMLYSKWPTAVGYFCFLGAGTMMNVQTAGQNQSVSRRVRKVQKHEIQIGDVVTVSYQKPCGEKQLAEYQLAEETDTRAVPPRIGRRTPLFQQLIGKTKGESITIPRRVGKITAVKCTKVKA